MALGVGLAATVIWVLAFATFGGREHSISTTPPTESTATTTPTDTDPVSTVSSPTTTPTDTAPVSTVGSPTTQPSPPCDHAGLSAYDQFGTTATLAPNPQPISVSIGVGTGDWCTAGSGTADVAFTNLGTSVEAIDTQLILSQGPGWWPLEKWPIFDVGPGETRTLHASFALPPLGPGTYSIMVGGLPGSASVTILGPSVCTEGNLRLVSTSRTSVSSHLRTDVKATNTSSSPCLLLRPTAVLPSTDVGGRSVTFTTGTYFGDPAPRSSNLLDPGASAMLWLETSTSGACATPSPPWNHVALLIGPSFTGFDVIGAPLDTGCIVGISNWGSAG